MTGVKMKQYIMYSKLFPNGQVSIEIEEFNDQLPKKALKIYSISPLLDWMKWERRKILRKLNFRVK
jgi:hypothetical protein